MEKNAENREAIEKAMDGAETKPAEKKTPETSEDRKALEKAVRNPILMFAGKMKLKKPILSQDKEITELHYDYDSLTNEEYMRAMDSDRKADPYGISHRQAMALFAFAAKGNEGLDARDIIERISAPDGMGAQQLSINFFHFSLSVSSANLCVNSEE